MKLGARAFKTGLATAIALYIASAFGFKAGIFAAVAAVTSIKPSIQSSVHTIFQQIQANILGAILAIGLVLSIGNEPFLIGFGIMIAIGICLLLKVNEDATFIAIITVIAIMDSTDLPFLQFAGIRISSIMIGIASAFVVNSVFLPPKHEMRLFEHINETTNDILQWIRVTTRHLSNQPALKKEIKRLDKELSKIDQIYAFYMGERIYSQKKAYARARKLVLFKQMIETSKKAHIVLQNLHRLDYDIEHIEAELNKELVEEIDLTLNVHEELILTYLGRIREHSPGEDHLTESNIPVLVESLMDERSENLTVRLKLLPLASTLMDYHNELMHFKRLLNSYQKHI
ncbi:FUSC family protein [Bacillaceae bacterium W0354]